jgi:hypothetical protein
VQKENNCAENNHRITVQKIIIVAFGKNEKQNYTCSEN